jgi:hypothetical protein
MMKHALILSASLAFGLTSVVAHAGDTAAPSLEAAGGSYEVAGLMWRCPKSNPVADWGWIGNGCLKQRLAAKKKKSSASAGTGGFTIETPPPPPPPPKKRLAQ